MKVSKAETRTTPVGRIFTPAARPEFRQYEDSIEPLAVSPKVAGKIGGWGHTRTYELINSGELESYRDGGSRRITMASIKARIAKLIAEQQAS